MPAPLLSRETVPGSPVRPPRLRSPLARAVVPVLAGIVVIGLIFLATWVMAVLSDDTSERLVPTEFNLGRVEARADSIAEDGPIVLPDLNTRTGTRTIVVDHTGDDPTRGWTVFWGYPADRDPSCTVEQVEGTATFVDCDGRQLDVTDLAPPEGVRPRVDDGTTLWIDLRAP